MAKSTKLTAPKSKPMPDGKSVHATEPTREPNWTPRRVAVVKAMRALGAVSATEARPAEEITAKASKSAPELVGRVDLVKIILDVYRTSELLHNGFAKSCKHEGERGLRYYLTAKGVKTEFPQPKKKADAKKGSGKDLNRVLRSLLRGSVESPAADTVTA